MTETVTTPPETLSPMQSELLNRADQIFSSIANSVAQAGSFVAEQVPDVALQYVAFGRAYQTALLVLGLSLFIFGIYMMVSWACFNKFNRPSDRDGAWGGSRVVMFIGSLFPMIIGFIIFFTNIKDTLLVWFAPKVWLILELAELAKSFK